MPKLSLNADITVHLVYVDFGKLGIEIVGTDPALASEKTIIDNVMSGEYMGAVVKIVAFNHFEGWSRDVTEDIAIECLNRLEPGESIRRDLLEFIEAHTDFISAVPLPAADRAAELETV